MGIAPSAAEEGGWRRGAVLWHVCARGLGEAAPTKVNESRPLRSSSVTRGVPPRQYVRAASLAARGGKNSAVKLQCQVLLVTVVA